MKLIEHPGYRTPLQIHERTDESFYVLEGSLTFHADGKAVVVGLGDYVFIPRNTPHAQGNTTASDTILLTTLVPGDFAAFFRARAELVALVPPDHPNYGARMQDLGKHHDIKVLGPAPFQRKIFVHLPDYHRAWPGTQPPRSSKASKRIVSSGA